MEMTNPKSEDAKEKYIKEVQKIREKSTKRAEEELRSKLRGNRTSLPPHVVHN